MDNRNRWWLTLIALGMVAYPVLVIWAECAQTKLFPHRAMDWLLLFPAVLMGTVGGLALVRELVRQPDDPAPHVLAPAMDKFVSAWRIFWNTRWLLWLYGVLGVVVVSGRLLHDTVMHFYMIQRFGDVAQRSFPVTIDRDLLQATPMMVRGAFERFIPMVPSITTGLSYLLVALLLVLWVLPRVIIQTRGDSNRGFFAFCITIAALGCGAVAYDYARTYRSLFAAGSGATPLLESKLALLSLYIVGLMAALIVDAALVGGILGSLLRMKNGETPASQTFWQDSVRFFLPLIGIYLIFEAIYVVQVVPGMIMSMHNVEARSWAMPSYIHALEAILPIVSLLAMPLLFAPFGTVTKSMSLGQSVSHSFDVWKRNWRQAFPLIGLGSFFFVISKFIYLLPTARTTRSWIPVPISALASLIGVFMSAWILLAVWEFYTSDVRDGVLVE